MGQKFVKDNISQKKKIRKKIKQELTNIKC